MTAVRFHRQLARSIYLFGIFTPNDFAVLIAAVALNVVVLNSNAAMLATLAGFPTYLAAFRLGRPAGNDAHLFGSWFIPRLFRPGREERKAPLAFDRGPERPPP